MRSGKYIYDPVNMKFEKLKFSFRQYIRRSLPFISLTLLLSFLVFHIYNNHLESPKLKVIKESQSEILLKCMLMRNSLSGLESRLENIEYNDDHIYRTYFEVEPLPPTTRNAGFGGHNYFEFSENSSNSVILKDLVSRLDKLATKTVVQSRSFDDIIVMARNKEKRLAARPAIQPVSINDLVRFGSAFGMRLHPILGDRRMHEGIDLTAPRGTKIFSTADGIVVEARFTGGGYGNKIVIDHGFGYRTLYGHLYKILVEPGTRVKRGDVIGLVGSTGLSVSPHLHYEVHVNGRVVNPVNYYANDLSAEEYDRMIDLLAKADPGFDIN